MRAILDANAFVSALISRIGSPARLIEEWLSGALEVVMCPGLLDEIERTLSAPGLSGRIDPADANRFLAGSATAPAIATAMLAPTAFDRPGHDDPQLRRRR